ncbi:RNA-directed DNA polymerase N-terminal domain protein [Candidatus Megaera venefica]|uniref:RNA-directed DNA polymerase N-terminal domain protein n=1 Tax=Candidatus Megaera venefica TaxID=2055910 RepID=A0ABU5NEW7_9RICK|nr:RNA-directed DNA polymerase N-terminal domain protein [Candidatus Megaera venefica]
MSRKKMTLKYKKERSVLSDVLPYEVPITFTNWHFYNFLLRHKIKYHGGKIEWLAGDAVVYCIICLLFGIPKSPKPNIETKTLFDKERGFNQLPVNKWGAIPFYYKISHKQNEYRELAIPHPINQLQVIEFYDRYKELILYYCSISSFSIRHPKKVSKYIFYKDSTHYENLSDDSSPREESGKEYENLRSFFVYKDYSNVYKFYESDKYHWCEKKYNKLLKLDISKCFDSIYTHSLAWALLNKESVKNSIHESKETFAGHFDKLMQQINYNETNGIIIGPEFSGLSI